LLRAPQPLGREPPGCLVPPRRCAVPPAAAARAH